MSEWTQSLLHFSQRQVPELAAAAPTRSPHFAGRDAGRDGVGGAELAASGGSAAGDDAGFAVI